MPEVPGYLFHNSPAPLGGESSQVLLQAQAFRLERIESHGHPSPEGFWYDQPQAEWVVLLRGTATLAFAEEPPVELKVGDYLLIPAHRKHRVEHTSSDALWLAVHFAENAGRH